MSHIHLPDGILPAWLWLGGYALAAAIVAALWRGGEATAAPRRFARRGVLSGLKILVVSNEVPPQPYHFNLSVVTALLVGPRLAVLAAFLVSLLLGLMGHGGLTVVGLNTLVLSLEMLAGILVFRAASRAGMGVAPAAFLATFAGLACGTAASFGVLAAAGPWIDRALQAAVLVPREQLAAGVVGTHLDLRRLAFLFFGFGAIGWVLESILAAAVVTYLHRASPGLFGGEE